MSKKLEPLKLGDRVKLDVSNNSRRGDYEADFIGMLGDRDISGRAVDTFWKHADAGAAWTVTKVEPCPFRPQDREADIYEIKIGRFTSPFMHEREDLIKVNA